MTERDPVPEQVAAALRAAAEASDEAQAVFGVVSGPDGRLVDLRILYANPTYWPMVGLEPDGALGRTFAELGRQLEFRSGIARLVAEAVETGRPLPKRRLVVRPQLGPHVGKERWVEVEIALAEGTVFVGFRDVTEAIEAADRQAAEARRTAALARFLRAAVEPAGDHARLLDVLAREGADALAGLCLIAERAPSGDLRLVAAAGGGGDVESLFRPLVGRAVIVSEAVRPLFLAGDDILLTALEPEAREQIAVHLEANGLPRSLADRVTSIIGAAIRSGAQPIGRLHVYRFGGSPFGPEDLATVAAMRDAAALVFERRSAVAEVAAALARFEALFEQAPVPMLVVGFDRTVRFNEAAVRLFGRPLAELGRFTFRADAPWIPPGQVEQFEALRRRLLAGEPVERVAVEIVRPSGERRQVEGSAFPIRTPAGEEVGMIVAFVDLTERLALEAQLAQAQKMEAIGRLAGGIAHDFANLLMAILGYAELVAADARAGRVTPDDADQIVVAARRAIDLTRRLRDLARKRAEGAEASDLREVAEAVLALARRIIPESIEVVVDLAPVETVRVDPAAFEQAFLNLLVNAVDAMPEGGRLTIVTRMAADEDPERPVVVAVADTGHGMDESTRQRLFEPFFTTKPVGVGTGLGLASVRAMVEQAGGRIEVATAPGSGSAFTLRFPVAERRLPADERAGAAEPTGEARQLPHGTETILLLEDDPAVRGEVERVLRRLGYRVLAAARPSEAFALAAGEPIDLLVTDVVLPEMSGPKLVAEIRARRPDLPVVLMSGYQSSERSAAGGGAGSDEARLAAPDLFRVDKPLSVAELARLVRAALDRRRA